MKKQYVLEDKEYYSICNTFEHLRGDIRLLHSQLDDNQKKEVTARLVEMEKRIKSIHQQLEWCK